MKKANAFIVAALAASMLTSCGGTDMAEVTSAESTVSETTAAAVSETGTLSAESEETTTEAAVGEPIDEPVTETDDLEDEPITDEDEPESLVKADSSFVYKEFEFKDYQNDHLVPVTQDSVPDEMVEAALAALETAGIERYDYFMSYDPENENAEYKIDDYEYWLVDGKPRPTVWEALYRDFDHNGTNEAFILFRTPWHMVEVPMAEDAMCFLVFVNSDNEAQYLCRVNGDIDGVLEYPEFTHVLVRGWYNNMSMDGHIFAVNGDAAADVLHIGRLSESNPASHCMYIEDNQIIYDAGGYIEPKIFTWDYAANAYVLIEE